MDAFALFCKQYTLLHHHHELDMVVHAFRVDGDMRALSRSLVLIMGKQALLHVLSVAKGVYTPVSEGRCGFAPPALNR